MIRGIGPKLRHIFATIQKPNSAIVSVPNAQKSSVLHSIRVSKDPGTEDQVFHIGIKKRYTLEKIDIAVKEELGK